MAPLGSLPPGGTITVGIIVGLLSTCIQSFGLTLQRKSHILEDEKEDCEIRRPAYRRRRWQIGMFLFLIANIVGSSIQITTLPLPLLSTLQASGLVFNSILATLLLHEPWTRRTIYGTILVAGGAAMISFFSAIPEPSRGLRELLELLMVRAFLVWFFLSLFLVIVMLMADLVMRKFVRDTESPRLLLIRGMSYGAISGILSAHALLLAKSTVGLIVRSVADRQNQFSNYHSWLLLLAFLVLALSQLYYLHLGLRLVSTSILYPFVFCIYNIVAILDGLIYFRQMDRLPPLHAGLIALGTVILLAGVLALSWRLEDPEEEDHEHRRRQTAPHEIPQTVLTPGLGFVGDPSDSDETESAVADEDEIGELGERQPLVGRAGLKRANTSKSSRSGRMASASKRRKRASTLKEVIDIWEELGDHDDSTFGTFKHKHDKLHSSTPALPARPQQSTGHAQRTLHRRNSSGQALEGGNAHRQAEGDEDDLRLPLRARTMPHARSRSGRRRRRSTHGGNSALFKDMLNIDWWRTRRKSDGEEPEDDEHAHENGR